MSKADMSYLIGISDKIRNVTADTAINYTHISILWCKVNCIQETMSDLIKTIVFSLRPNAIYHLQMIDFC